MILTSDTFVRRSSSWKYKWDSCSPCFSSLALCFTARHCEANWKALSLLRLVLKWALLRNWVICSAALAYSRQTPLLRARASSALPHWSQTRCCGLGWRSARGPKLSRVQHNQEAPGCTQTWPRASHLVWVNNTSWMACLQSPQQGQKTSLNLSGWLSDVEQMCWNGGNYVTSFSPLSCDRDD